MALLSLAIRGGATITNDPMAPVARSLSDASSGRSELHNQPGAGDEAVPTTASIRRSDFQDFGVTDAITDRHRGYPASVVLPVEKAK
jgi:hypothetical protein